MSPLGPDLRRPDLYSLRHGPHRPAQRHRHAPVAGDAPGDGRRRARRRRLRRRPDGHRARGARRRAARQGGRAVRRLAGRWATSSPRWPTSRAARRPSPAASTTSSSTRRPATRSSSARASGRCEDRPDGTLDPAEIDAAFRDPTDVHEPITGLVTIENTHAHSMGQPLTPDYTREVGRHRPRPRRPAPRRRRAVLERGRRPRRPPRRDLAGPADTVTFCLSKGLGLPGRLRRRRTARLHLARAPRAQAGRWRDAPGRASSRRPGWSRSRDGPDGMIERLAEDHANARRLAEALAELDGIVSRRWDRPAGARPARPGRASRTNFVVFRVERDRAAFLAALRARGRRDGGISARAGPRRDPLRGRPPPTSRRPSTPRGRPWPTRDRRSPRPRHADTGRRRRLTEPAIRSPSDDRATPEVPSP